MNTSFERFQEELGRLVAAFEKGFNGFTAQDYSEARLREDFLNPLFRALGWDMENKRGLVQNQREVEIESRTDVAGRAKRADYLFRVENRERFVCEAKKPREVLGDRYAFQTKRYAWNKGLPLAVLSDFEEIKIYVVGGKPHIDRADDGLWKTWNFRQYPLVAQELWNLLARERVAGGSIEALLDSLPRAKPAKGKARQQWLIRPERTKGLDQDFLEYLDEQRRALASDLLNGNKREDILADGRINEAAQRIIDRLLFLRICEDRDIDTGCRLAKIVETWRRAYGHEDQRKLKQGRLLLKEEAAEYKGAAPRESLWWAVVSHLRALDRRPPSNMPFFNGNLFKPHFSEDLRVGDQWLCDFIEDISADESPYLFSVIPVEILGSVYERFLGKVVRPHGRGVTIEEKPEVRKAGGVYYTPRYIVDYIVEQTVGKQLDAIAKEDKAFAAFDKKTRALRILDPACGSGSFLIRAFERVCEHYQRRFTTRPEDRKPERCWTDPRTGDVHLTVDLKRRILRDNIYGVDLDAQAVEVTQLSLYLKMLEGEDRTSIEQQRKLFRDDIALLPPLGDNIKHGNSLIASDFSLVPEDLLRVHAFDWDVGFKDIMKAGGFDAVIGNPPYVLLSPESFAGEDVVYLRRYKVAQYKTDLFHLFIEKGIALNRANGRFGMIVPNTWLTLQFTDRLRRFILDTTEVDEIVVFEHQVFEDADVFTALLFLTKTLPRPTHRVALRKPKKAGSAAELARTPREEVPQRVWSEKKDAAFEVRQTGPQGVLAARLMKKFPSLESNARASLGCQAYNSSKHTKEQIEKRVFHATKRISSEYLPELAGNDVSRYEFERQRGQWIKYGPWLHDYRTLDWLQGPRILIREITGPAPHRILGCYLEDTYCHYKTILNVNPSANTACSMKYLLGVLNSRLISFVYPFVSNKMVARGFPRLSVGDVKHLPIRVINFSDSSDRARHDKLVELVEKMLALMPKLRSETNESKKKTLQNAVDATDRQIDRLVYELYGLTEEEIRIVEGSGS